MKPGRRVGVRRVGSESHIGDFSGWAAELESRERLSRPG